VRHRFTRSVLRLSGLAAAVGAGLIAVTTAAGAATASGPASPVMSALPNAAAMAAGPQVFTTTYSCDTSVLNSATGLPSPGDVTVSATLTVPASVVEGKSVPITLATQVAPLPAGAAQEFPAVNSIALGAVVPLSGPPGHEVVLSGFSGPVAAQAAQLPAIEASGGLGLSTAGVTTATTPAEISLTLNKPSGDSATALKCNAARTATLKIKVTAPAPPAPTPPAGPDYTCAFSTNVPGAGKLPSSSGPLPFLATVTGQHTTGSTDVVSLAPNLGGENIASELGDLSGLGIRGTAFAAKVPVTGAGHGAIVVTGKTVGLTSKVLTGTGRLYLASPGTYHLRAPEVFTFALIGPSVKIAGQTITVTITMACKLTSADSVLAALTVTGQPVAASGHGGSTNGSGTAASGAVPAGAPNTGGGTAPGSSLPLILGGVALLLAGGGGTVFAVRRRRLSPPSA
jgi:hypothetical protein